MAIALTGNGNESVTSSVEPTSRPSSCPVTRFGAHSWQCFTSLRITWPSSCTARSRLSFACGMSLRQVETTDAPRQATPTGCMAHMQTRRSSSTGNATGRTCFSYNQALSRQQEQSACNQHYTFAGADVAAAKFMGSLTPMAAAGAWSSSLRYAGARAAALAGSLDSRIAVM
jgi:hypothetical protein